MTQMVVPAAPQLPGLPGLPGPNVSVSPANPFLDWLHLADGDGGQIAHYRLLLEPRFFDILHRVVYAGGADLLYSLGYLLGSSYAAAIMRVVLDPNQWLAPVTTFYNGITSKVYSVIPPTAIMTATFAILVLSVFGPRSGTSAGALPHPPRLGGPAAAAPRGLLESNSQIGKAQWQRLGSGLVMMGVVTVLAANPFTIIQEIVDAVLALAQALSFTGNQGGTAHYVTTTTTDFMRAVTFLVNYRQILDPACAHMWSMSINIGGSNPKCLTPSQGAAADPDLWTVGLAFASVFIAWAFLSFSIVVALEFFKHLSLAVGNTIAATWIAAATLARRRPYDPLAQCAARAATHGLLALVVLFISATGPALFLQLITSVLSFVPVLVQVLLAAGGYYLSGKLILVVAEKKTSLLGLFRDKVTKSPHWTNLYPPAAPATVASTVTEGTLDKPGQWGKQQFRGLTGHSTRVWNEFKDSLAGPAPDQGDAAMTVPIVKDSPQFLAATQRPKLHDKPTDTVVITGDEDPAAPADTAAESAAASSVVVGPTGQAALTAGPVDPTPTTAGAPPSDPHNPPLVWFRAGLPQFWPPAPQYGPPTALYSPAIAAPPPPAPSSAPPSITGQDWGLARHRITDAMRADAAILHATPTPPQSTEEILARTTGTYRNYQPTPPPDSAPNADAPARTRRTPDLRSVLAAAQWAHKFNHTKNLLRARGVEAIPVLSATEESLAKIVFATDSAGRNIVAPKNDRGFGDWI